MPDGFHPLDRGAQFAIQDTALAEARRRELIGRAIDRIEYAERQRQWDVCYRDYMEQAAELLEQAGRPDLADRAEAMVPFGGDVAQLLKDTEAAR